MHSPSTTIARRIVGIPQHIVHDSPGDEAVRALVNWLGSALAASRDAYLDAVPQRAPVLVGNAEATVLGLDEQVDLAAAAELTAGGADTLHYTDSDVATLLRPGTTVAGAALPLAEHLQASGAAFVHACLIGTEVACRAAHALDAGPLDPLGTDALTCNALGATAACATLLNLDPERIAHALRIATADASAMTFGRADSAAGRAARLGLLAALGARAAAGESASSRSHEYDPLQRRFPNAEAFEANWGRDWHASRLAYHPFPCALHVHPVTEACIQLKRLHHLTGRQLARVRVALHPCALRRDRSKAPDSTAEARASAAHVAAVALLDGEIRHLKLRNPRVRELRVRIEVVEDDALPATGARVTVVAPNGIPLERTVRCAAGHPLRPLQDGELTDKFRALAGEHLATAQVERLLGLAWNVRALPDIGGLIRATIPEDVYEPTELPGSPLIPR